MKGTPILLFTILVILSAGSLFLLLGDVRYLQLGLLSLIMFGLATGLWLMAFYRSGKDFFSPLCLFVGFFGLYSLVVPFTLLFGRVSKDFRLSSIWDVPLVSRVTLVYLLALCGFIGGYFLPGGRWLAQQLPLAPARLDLSRLTGIAFGYLVAGGGLYGIYLIQVGGIVQFLASSYEQKYEMQFGQGPLALGLVLISIALLLKFYVGLTKPAGRAFYIWWFLGASLYIGFILAVGMRSQVGAFFFAVVVIYQRARRVLPSRFVLFFGLVGYLCLSLLIQTRMLVGYSAWERVQYIAAEFTPSWLDPGDFEFDCGFRATMDILAYAGETAERRYGWTYIAAVGHIVPLFLNPQRTMSASAWYVSRFYPGISKSFGGLAFSPVAEAYLNFGILGPPLVFLFLGITVRTLDVFLERCRLRPSVGLLYAGIAWYLCYFHRLDAELAIKGVLFTALPYFAAVALARGTAAAHGDRRLAQRPSGRLQGGGHAPGLLPQESKL